ncbi:MAG TPA: hypothetical protein VF071_13740 [Candidatus Limnocylindria bacterium]
MHRLTRAIGLGAVLSLLASSITLAAPPPNLDTLDPGGTITLEQTLPVNIVFVGYEQGAGDTDVNEADFLGGLASRYETINRYLAFYGLPADAHVNFTYDYNLVWADGDFEDEFFGYLGGIATPADLTVFQEDYNAQANNVLDVTDNHFIDAPSVEQWLADNAWNELGVDTSQYTVFLVNWYDRPDFIHHIYTKTDEPDPDTGYNFGELRETRKFIAWGGTTADDEESGLGSTHRIWFYDLSAGPEAWTDNWNVDDLDPFDPGNADAELQYRMPPVWEYGNLSGYRPFDDLTGDLAKVTRYVAMDLLFTTSPLYKPALSSPALPDDIQLDINAFDNAGVDVASLFDLGLINAELGELKPDVSISSELTIRDLAGRLEDVYHCFAADQDSCFGFRLFNIAFGDLFLYFSDHLLKFLEGDSDYELPLFAFYGAEDLEAGGLLGFADDDWRSGTQSYVFAFDDPFLESIGYGFSTTTIHEVGHHVGLSHPHDGWDSEDGIDFGPGGDFYFAWSGDESNSIMSYIDLNWDFSQFDRDNMNRYMTATYLNTANAVLAKIYASPRAGRVSGLLTDADADAATALAAYGSYDWAGAMLAAEEAFRTVMEAAAAINVQVEPQSYQADYKARGESYAFVDPVNHHRGE